MITANPETVSLLRIDILAPHKAFKMPNIAYGTLLAEIEQNHEYPNYLKHVSDNMNVAQIIQLK